MLEKHYGLYVNTNYLPSTLSSESDIKNSIYNYIVNNTSFPTTSLTNTQLASIIVGHTQSVGVSGYYLVEYILIRDGPAPGLYGFIRTIAHTNFRVYDGVYDKQYG